MISDGATPSHLIQGIPEITVCAEWIIWGKIGGFQAHRYFRSVSIGQSVTTYSMYFVSWTLAWFAMVFYGSYAFVRDSFHVCIKSQLRNVFSFHSTLTPMS